MSEYKVDLIATSRGNKLDNLEWVGPEELSAYSAAACHNLSTSRELMKFYNEEKDWNERKEMKEEVFQLSVGAGHTAILDQNSFFFSIEDLPRAATLQLCLPEYLSHLQQSMRFVSAERGYTLPEKIKNSDFHDKTKDVLDESFELYEEMCEEDLPKEDARFILPLYSKTNIQTKGDARALSHLYKMSEESETPSLVLEVVEGMMEEAEGNSPELFKDRDHNYEQLFFRPSAQLYSENKTLAEIIESEGEPKEVSYVRKEINDKMMEKVIQEKDEAELANLKHFHNNGNLEGYLASMSIAALHQSIRQRTWNHTLESIYDAADRGRIVTPSSIKDSEYAEEFRDQNEKMLGLYEELIEDEVPRKEAVGVVPHSLGIYDLLHIDGWNAIYSIGRRTCSRAQWEIREIANEIAEMIRENNPSIGKFARPQGVTIGECPEEYSCGKCEEIRKELGIEGEMELTPLRDSGED